MDIMTNAKFPSFGPWDGGNISAFWTLNLYTNQRHLGLSFALSLFVIFLILRKKRGVLPGIILGLLLFTNQAAAGITILFLIWFFCAKPDMRKTLFAAGITTIPFIILLTRLTTLPSGIAWQPGYLTPEPLTIQSFLIFWFLNLGLHSLFIPIGFLLAPRRITKLFLVPLLILFILPNLFRFSPDMINNHKFFNFFMIIGAMFSAYAVTKFLDWKFSKINNDSSAERSEKIEFAVVGARTRSFMRERDRRTLDFGRATSALVIIFFLIFSGIIDLFPIFNDTKIRLVDLAGDPDIRFFSTIPAGSIVANSTWFYHPASLAGRPIFNGYSYFTWSYGYDQITRERETITLYQIQTREEACVLFKKHHISYLELSKNPESFLKPNTQLWQSLPAVYRNPSTGLSVYNVTTLCR
ncbi:hypothetical protein HY948_04230 [Candidatus Gottesmanbacteria bacterium]|nr:hypothetical protein [Candidatus Gottesmanbacteria bacterium]